MIKKLVMEYGDSGTQNAFNRAIVSKALEKQIKQNQSLTINQHIYKDIQKDGCFVSCD